MTVRIRMQHGPTIERTAANANSRDSNRIPVEEIAGGLAELLTPATIMALALAVWRLAADLRFAGPFFIEQGILSHYQTWFAIAGLLQANVIYLKKRAARATVIEP